MWAFLRKKKDKEKGQGESHMSKSSIHFSPVAAGSELHLGRDGKYEKYNSHIDKELSENNEDWKLENYQDPNSYRKELEIMVKEKTGRAMQKKATPIREAVLNIKPETSLEDLTELTYILKKKYGLIPLRISIHRDEGNTKSKEHINHHAHIVFDFMNHETGKSIKLNKDDMSTIQDLTALVLRMERGEKAILSGKEHLTPDAYKQQEEIKKIEAELAIKKMQAEHFRKFPHLSKKEVQTLKHLQCKLVTEQIKTKSLSKKLKQLNERLKKQTKKLEKSKEKVAQYLAPYMQKLQSLREDWRGIQRKQRTRDRSRGDEGLSR